MTNFIKIFLLLVAISLGGHGVSHAESAKVSDNESIKAFHFVLRSVSLERGQWLVDVAKRSGFNTVVIAITDGLHLDSAPWTSRDNSWSKNDFVEWVEYTKSIGLSIVPQLSLLSHQEKFFQGNYPSLMFNKYTYDVRQSEVYDEHVFPVLDEIISIVSPKAFHIGHDEVAGFSDWWWRDKLKKTEALLPADLFLEDVKKINDYLSSRGVEVWMWGDMLIEHHESKDMDPHFFHGSALGYGKALRQRIPKSVVICDWHYRGHHESFATVETFVQDGFRVLGTTFKDFTTTEKFSSFAAKGGASGMIATTWFHVQRREWNIVENILEKSGSIYIRYFDDD